MTHPFDAPARIAGRGVADAATVATVLVGRAGSSPVTGARLSLWRAAAVFRVVSLVFCLGLILKWRHLYAHPSVAYAVGVGMVLTTVAVCGLALSGRAHRWTVVTADLAVTVLLTLATSWAQTPFQRAGHMATLTTVWAAGPVIEAGFLGAWVGGIAFGIVQLAAALTVRHGYDANTVSSGALLVIAGGVVGYVAQLVVRTEGELARAVAAQAAVAERERLARSIHDGVLQVLGLVHRSGRDAGGRWQELAAQAATHEAALRALITSRPEPTSAGDADLGDQLRALGRERVTVSAPGTPVVIDARRAGDLVAAVRAALHNVEEHNGADVQAWILLEDLGDSVKIMVRDDGVGFDAARLIVAAREGRLGVSSSIVGRVQALGGTATVTSSPGGGTVVELSVASRGGSRA